MMAHYRILSTGLGLAILSACAQAPEPICNRDVVIDKYGNVELAECEKPPAVTRSPFPFGWLAGPMLTDEERRERRERRDSFGVDPVVPVVLGDSGGAIPGVDNDDPDNDEDGTDNPAPPAAPNDDGSSDDGGAPTTGGDGSTTTGGGGGTTTTGGGGGTPTAGGGDDDTPVAGGDGGTPTAGGDDGDDDTSDDGRPSTPEERAERQRLHHALRDATIARRNANIIEKEVRTEFQNTPKSDPNYQSLREQNLSLIHI